MVNKIYKTTFYIVVSIALSYLIGMGNGCFFDFFKNNIIALLSTLLAINITASALISAELNRLKQRHPNASIKKGNEGLRRTFIFQIILLVSLFIILIIRDLFTELELVDEQYVLLFSDAAIVGVFLYYIEVIYDLGCALYNILQFNSNEDDIPS